MTRPKSHWRTPSASNPTSRLSGGWRTGQVSRRFSRLTQGGPAGRPSRRKVQPVSTESRTASRLFRRPAGAPRQNLPSRSRGSTPACPPTFAVRGRDLQRQLYVDSGRPLGARSCRSLIVIPPKSAQLALAAGDLPIRTAPRFDLNQRLAQRGVVGFRGVGASACATWSRQP